MKKLLRTRFRILFSTICISFSLYPVAVNAQEQALKANPDAAKDKISMCIGCHSLPGYKASFPEVYHVPMIAGQNAQYIETALRAYAKSERTFPTMHAVAVSLTDQDIADIAAYYSSLKRELRSSP